MLSAKQIFAFLFSLSIFSFSLFSAERDYSDEKYCHLHQEQTNQLNLIAENLSLIPPYRYQCCDVKCSQCHHASAHEYGFYDEDTDEEWTEWNWKCPCKDKFLEDKGWKNFDDFWDYWMPSWKRCPSKAIYHGYLSKKHSRYFSYFHEYLQYLSGNQSCTCLWPELSEKASKINTTAYLLFNDLFKKTDLKKLVKDKAAKKLTALKRANTMFTLENCTISQAKQVPIIKESTKHANFRSKIISEAASKGKILVKSSNTIPHIMKPKQAWDKLVKLTGNVEEDFKRIVTFLEEIHITDKANLKEVVKYGNNSSINVTLSEYRKTVTGFELQVFFENYLDTGESFLKNAWVITIQK